MASLSISSYMSVGTTTATVSYSASGWTLPPNESSSGGDSANGYSTTTVYSDLRYSWSFNDGGSSGSLSGIHTFSGLSPGMQERLSGTISAYCTAQTTTNSWWTVKVPVQVGTDANGLPIYEYVDELRSTSYTNTSPFSLGSETATLTVYTHPGDWPWWDSLATGDIIEFTLYAEDWNNLIVQAHKYKKWKAQSDNVSIINCTVSSGDLITANIYNQMADNCGTGHVRGGYNGDIITPDLFKALAWAVSRRE